MRDAEKALVLAKAEANVSHICIRELFLTASSLTHLAAYHYLVPKLELQKQRGSPPQLTSLYHLPEHRIRCSPSRQQSCLRRLYASFGNVPEPTTPRRRHYSQENHRNAPRKVERKS